MTGISESHRLPQRHRQRDSAQRLGYEAAKRVLDIVVALSAIVVTAPVLIALYLLTRSTSVGPAVFRQQRLGRGRQPFTLLKFRTMHDGSRDDLHREYVVSLAEEDQAAPAGPRGLHKLESDPRVTRVGSWLRRTSLDELPQLFNVLKGDMSLVGPRPVLAWEAEIWPLKYPGYNRRFEVKPGMTGLWQVSGRGRLPPKESIDLDVEYVDRRSFTFDLLILLRTLPAMLRGGAA